MTGNRQMRQDLHPDPEQELLEGAEYSQFVSAMPLMVNMARHGANSEALSYRKFHVGASAYAITFDGSKPPMVIGGANYKPDQETPKYCAEMDVLDHALENGYDHILGMVIAGTDDPEDIRSVMHRVTPTLHPCDVCQSKMDGSDLIAPDTLIVTIALDSDKAQIHTFDDLKLIYEVEEQEGDAIQSPAITLDLANWRQHEEAFDAITQASADTDPVKITRLALSSTVRLED